MRTRLPLPLVLAAAALLALASLVAAARTSFAEDAPGAAETVFIQMHIWQHIDDVDNLWISARRAGGRWDTLGTIPFPLDNRAGGYSPVSKFRYADLAMAGVGLRVWQPETERERVFVQACIASCPGREPGVRLRWRPLGMNPFPLDDGHSTSGRYRYGDLTVVVPRNPGLLADREHLLALRDVLEGGAMELDWSPSRAAEDWEGVTVSGTPPRVTGLDLSGRGLAGEIWGYLGDLTELTALRFDGNRLTGIIPSKLALLANLTHVYLRGNGLEHCVPPPLRTVPDNDLESLGLPDCPAPERVAYKFAFEGTHWAYSDATVPNTSVVFDIPVARVALPNEYAAVVPCDSLEVTSTSGAMDCSHRRLALMSWSSSRGWVVVVLDMLRLGEELERTHYSGCVYDCGPDGSPSALLEQLAASVWLNAVGEDGEWVWP